MKNTIMNIAYAADENYAKYLYISISSVLKSNKNATINFFIIDNGISIDSKLRIDILIKSFNQNVKYILFSKELESLNVDNSFPISSYSRLFLSKIEEIDKVIYFDCDTLIIDDLLQLWAIDIEDYFFAGVIDPVISYYKKSIGLKKNDLYINAGVIMMNLKLLREVEWENKVFSLVNKLKGSIAHHDQGVINALGLGRIKFLSHKFNYMDLYFAFSKNQLQKISSIKFPFTIEEYNNASVYPVCIHFTAGVYGRVWDKKSTHPKKQLYKDQVTALGLELDQFYIDFPSKRTTRIMNLIHKNLPFILYLLLSKLSSLRKSILKRRKHL